jgi:hypothetical protein
VDHIRLQENSAIATANGASGGVICPGSGFIAENENPGTNAPDPKCSDTGIRASCITAHNGSQ